jgi:molybdopterin-binding protein
MNISARNKIFGKITKLTSGVVNTEVVIAVPGGGELVSVITKTSAKSLKLKKGSPVVAVIKSSDILLAVPCGNPNCKCGK